MKTSISRVANKQVLPQWMLESANQQNAHTTSTTASSYKKQKMSDSFYGRIKHHIPLQDASNSKKSCLDYFKEEYKDQKSLWKMKKQG